MTKLQDTIDKIKQDAAKKIEAAKREATVLDLLPQDHLERFKISTFSQRDGTIWITYDENRFHSGREQPTLTTVKELLTLFEPLHCGYGKNDCVYIGPTDYVQKNCKEWKTIQPVVFAAEGSSHGHPLTAIFHSEVNGQRYRIAVRLGHLFKFGQYSAQVSEQHGVVTNVKDCRYSTSFTSTDCKQYYVKYAAGSSRDFNRIALMWSDDASVFEWFNEILDHCEG